MTLLSFAYLNAWHVSYSSSVRQPVTTRPPLSLFGLSITFTDTLVSSGDTTHTPFFPPSASHSLVLHMTELLNAETEGGVA